MGRESLGWGVVVVMVGGGVLHNSYRVIQIIIRTESAWHWLTSSALHRIGYRASLSHVPLYSKTFAASTINDTPLPHTQTHRDIHTLKHTCAHILQSLYPGLETVAFSTLCTSDGTFITLIINNCLHCPQHSWRRHRCLVIDFRWDKNCSAAAFPSRLYWELSPGT